jgi:hypothetical protein
MDLVCVRVVFLVLIGISGCNILTSVIGATGEDRLANCQLVSLTKHYRAADPGQPVVIRMRKNVHFCIKCGLWQSNLVAIE